MVNVPIAYQLRREVRSIQFQIAAALHDLDAVTKRIRHEGNATKFQLRELQLARESLDATLDGLLSIR